MCVLPSFDTDQLIVSSRLNQSSFVKKLRQPHSHLRYQYLVGCPDCVKSMRLQIRNRLGTVYNEKSCLVPSQLHDGFENLIFGLRIQSATGFVQNEKIRVSYFHERPS